jgi:hypothetical protein
MNETKTDEAADLPEDAAALPRWVGAPYIPLGQQLNGQCVELVCELANDPTHQHLPQFVLQNRDLFRLLEPEARKRVAAFPFVIVKLRFNDTESWQQASDGNPMAPADAALPPKLFEDLALEILLFARQAAREDASVAKVMFAMTPAVVRLIASLTVSQVRAIAVANAGQIRVCWDNDPGFWGELLVACRAGEEKAMASVRRQGKLLFLGV